MAISRSSRPATPTTSERSVERIPLVSRPDGRQPDELRPITITRNWLDHAEGSVLIEFGRTRVLCAATVTQGVPRWRAGSGLGWVTAEYAMLPRSTHTRSDRESVRGRIGGRTHEISRLVGRSLRACVDYKALGENTIVIDCDVLQADGGTRTAARRAAGGDVTHRVVLATRNAHKVSELRRILAPYDVELVGLEDFPEVAVVPETGATFAENALAKAHATATATGLTAVADDSGLAVDALNGMPGVLSARWAGRARDDRANLHLALEQVSDVPDGR